MANGHRLAKKQTGKHNGEIAGTAIRHAARQHEGPIARSPWIITVRNWTPPTINYLMRGKRRQKFGAAAKTRRALAGPVLDAVRNGVPLADERRRVLLILAVPDGNSICDADAMWKGLLDALTDLHMLRNDRPYSVELPPVVWEIGERTTTIVLEPLPKWKPMPAGTALERLMRRSSA